MLSYLRIALLLFALTAGNSAHCALYRITAQGDVTTVVPFPNTTNIVLNTNSKNNIASGTEFILQTGSKQQDIFKTLQGSYRFRGSQYITVNNQRKRVEYSGEIQINPNRLEPDVISFDPIPAIVFEEANATLQIASSLSDVTYKTSGFSGTPSSLTISFSLRATITDGVSNAPASYDSRATGADQAITCLRNGGCTTWSVAPMAVGLLLRDKPVGYRPPVGPSAEWNISYSQRDSNQPATFNYGNLGRKWTSNWHSHLTDNSSGGGQVEIYNRGGGSELYQFSSTAATASTQSPYSQSFIERQVGAGGLTIGFVRRMSDGSSEEFKQPASNLFFLTAVVDRYGRRVTLGYDATNRLVSITDAIGQRTTLGYESSDPFKLTRITDPFGRFARFTYTAAGQLDSITDTIGITSSFTYSSGDFVSTLTTPYGTTRFAFADQTTDAGFGTRRILQVTDALNRTWRYEYRDDVPGLPASESTTPVGMTVANTELNQRNTFIWNPVQYAAATAGGGLDYTKAKVIHWLRSTNPVVVSRVIESIKEPLEGRLWFSYAGQPNASTVGTNSQPIQKGRVLSDGRTQLESFQYNAQGNLVQSVDPAGRRMTYTYAANGIDLVQVANTTSGTDVLASITYNSQHLPLTVRGANGRATTLEYNAAGQPVRVIDALGNTTTNSYDASGYLTSVQGPLASSSFSFTYDTARRLASASGPAGSRVQYTYDDADRPRSASFSDTTRVLYDYNLLDLVGVTDRLGRKTILKYDAERQLVQSTDAAGQMTDLGYSQGGAMTLLNDPRGNVTRWARDLQDRAVGKTYPDGRGYSTSFDPATGWVTAMVDAMGQATRSSYNVDGTVASRAYANAVNATPSVTYTYDARYPRVTKVADGFADNSYTYHPAGVMGANRLRAVLSQVAGTPNADITEHTYDALDRVVSRTINGNVETTTYDALGRVTGVSNALDTFNYGYSDGTSRVTSVNSGNGPRLALEYFDATGNELLKKLTYTTAGGTVLSQFAYTHDANYNVTSFTESYINQRLPASAGAVLGSADGPLGGLLSTALKAPPEPPKAAVPVSRPVSPGDWLLLGTCLFLSAIGWQLTRSGVRRSLWPAAPVAMTLALASCGGGGGGEAGHPLSAAPQMASASQRAMLGLAGPAVTPRLKALAGTDGLYGATTAEDAVEQLFNKVAEPALPQYFPGRKQTLTFDRFRYRFYPETGIYLAVAIGVAPGSGLVESGVYVLGGAFGGNLVFVAKLLDIFTPTPTIAGRAQVTSYAYDAVDRLISGTVGTDVAPPSGAPKHAYRYDAASNLVSMTVDGVPKSLAYTATNALTSATYDANGNPISLDGWTYAWDAADRLVKATKGQSESNFTYDGQSRLVRIVDRQGGAVVSDKSYLWCGMARCLEHDNTKLGSPVSKQYFAQGVVVAGFSQYYITDQLGSVRQLVGAGGRALAQYQFDPYGSRTKVSGAGDADLGYAGLFKHQATGLDLAVYRAYDSQRGRWLNRDPVEEAGGANLYIYVSGNPTTSVDVLGLEETSAAGDSLAALAQKASGARVEAFATGLLWQFAKDLKFAIRNNISITGNLNELGAGALQGGLKRAIGGGLVLSAGIWWGEHYVYPAMQDLANSHYRCGYKGLLDDLNEGLLWYDIDINEMRLRALAGLDTIGL